MKAEFTYQQKRRPFRFTVIFQFLPYSLISSLLPLLFPSSLPGIYCLSVLKDLNHQPNTSTPNPSLLPFFGCLSDFLLFHIPFITTYRTCQSVSYLALNQLYVCSIPSCKPILASHPRSFIFPTSRSFLLLSGLRYRSWL